MNNFTRLKLKMLFLAVMAIIAASLVGSFILNYVIDGVLQAPFANAFVVFCRQVLRMTNDQALAAYQVMIRDNKTDLVLGGMILLILVFFYIAMGRFTTYLNQISDGVDKVVEETEEPITLPEELQPMEDKLNEIKTTLKRRQQEAAESEQRKNDLMVYLAHDLKTPLTSVIGYLTLLSEKGELTEETRDKYLAICLDKAERLEDLINEFFEITRYNLQNISVEKKRVDLSFLLEQIADEFIPMFQQKELSCSLQIPPGLVVIGDADKLARVFDNLLRNAISYSDPRSEIVIRGEKQENRVRVSVRNQGLQIPEHKLSSIFQKFFRLDEARRSGTGGAGLGLAIAKEIVDLHHGKIMASSNGKQTEFTVELPGPEGPFHTS
ncbi:sensor histidine kinase [Papillibacter cinnamivorans]|uniref:histidine kinase n=1 Tax=Papillibacter cinnamivorans DSM 12816 TaxID=1122930 RepID=A0A1W2A4A5_9FIRM|nr:HAMP domain-containing sensor histidine kinase [Papillibacter cinnamivorans]SMC55505.1 two-component system, OmpR family, sensor histidine kinase VanS [Papillibacter cinnamivorans DSM 12816]